MALVVWEFYDNADDNMVLIVFVFRKIDPIDKASINKFYKIWDIDNDGYPKFVKNENIQMKFLEFWLYQGLLEVIEY